MNKIARIVLLLAILLLAEVSYITSYANYTSVKLIIPGSSSSPDIKCKIENIQAKEIEAKLETRPGGYSLAVIHNPLTQGNYVLPASLDFYICDESGITGYKVCNGGDLVLTKYYIETTGTDGGINEIMARFKSEFSEEQLEQRNRNSPRVSLDAAAPLGFFTARSQFLVGLTPGPIAISSQPGQATIKAVDVSDGVMRIDLLSDGGKFSGAFWIDLEAQKVIKSIVEGQEMDINTGKPYAIPLHK